MPRVDEFGLTVAGGRGEPREDRVGGHAGKGRGEQGGALLGGPGRAVGGVAGLDICLA